MSINKIDNFLKFERKNFKKLTLKIILKNKKFLNFFKISENKVTSK